MRYMYFTACLLSSSFACEDVISKRNDFVRNFVLKYDIVRGSTYYDGYCGFSLERIFSDRKYSVFYYKYVFGNDSLSLRSHEEFLLYNKYKGTIGGFILSGFDGIKQRGVDYVDVMIDGQEGRIFLKDLITKKFLIVYDKIDDHQYSVESKFNYWNIFIPKVPFVKK
jgi:hypothetical protein